MPEIDPIALLRDLVAIPSVNPQEREAFSSPFGEAGASDYLEGVLRRSGIDCERQPAAPGRDNLLARLEGRDPGRTLLFECHVDTVGVDGYEGDPFDPVERDGRLYGRGACDAKAQVASMAAALLQVAASGQPAHTVLLAATVGEEDRFLGAQKLVGSGLAAEAGVVGEPTELVTVIAHKGAARFTCTTRGHAAHSSDPSRGTNAVYRMARVLRALEEHAEELLSRPAHRLLGTPTLSVGNIHGGTEVNVVPADCTIAVDRRVLPGEDALAAIEEVRAVIEAAPGVDFAVEIRVTLADAGMEIAEDAPIARSVLAACERALGWSALGGVLYGTDASKFVAAGLPTVVFGAGSVEQAHTACEYVDVEQVRQATAVHRTFMEEGLLTT